MPPDVAYPPIDITDDDFALLVAEVQRFCERTVRPLCAARGDSLSTQQVEALQRQAAEIGLLNFEPEPALGLWEMHERARGRWFSLAALRALAAVDAGVAFHFHQLALGGLLSRELQLDCQVPTTVCLQGSFGLGRTSLARLLLGKPLSDDDRAILADYFAPRACVPLLVQAADTWQRLLVPCLDEEHGLTWRGFDRAGLELEELPHSHGLDSTRTWEWFFDSAGGSAQIVLADPSARQSYQRLLQINAQALLAIALGAVQSGHSRAVEYAGVRRQGGCLIQEHPAVQQMLFRCQSIVWTVEQLLAGLAAQDISTIGLAKSFAARAVAHPLLCEAANDVLQVFGGLGYIRETGIERIVRDVNSLRLLAGTPDELLLFLAQWESPS